VIYSIDVLLDSGRYGPKYVAAVETLDPESVAFRMHFAPESLRHFALQYQNDHYRLFKVTEAQEMIFLTDHPPVYQRTLLGASGGDPEAFRRNIVSLIYNYAEGVEARRRGDLESALARLRTCVAAAPRFTQARLALADVYVDMDRLEEARAAVMEVIAYAPDNSLATYSAAFIHAKLGQYDQARAFLAVMRSHERDSELLEKARLLDVYMDQGPPLEPVAPAMPATENGRGD
jgi:tetratricopeptide (TPR) repeat protein